MRGAIVAVLACIGCGSSGELYRSAEYRQRDELKTSLLKRDDALIPEESIQRLLSSRIKIPEKAKLAVHAFPHRSVELNAWGSGPFLPARKELLTAIEDPLWKTGRLSEITHLPPMLLPAEPSLTRLRETAALMQADLLLVYGTRSERVSIWYLLAPNEVKVAGAMEFFLMDVKTGVVPLADTFETMITEKQTKEDDRLVETQRRAERTATLDVLRQAAEQLRGFFGRP